MLNTIKYINEKGLESLIDEYKLIARYSTIYPELVLLCYDQLDTPKNDITNECRGLIINTLDNSVVAYPFYRFNDYNGEKIDDNELKVFEKIDGSLITLYHYKDTWNVATKTTPDAHGLIYSREKSIRELFTEVFADRFQNLETDKTYVFEFSYHNNNIEKIKNHYTKQGITEKKVDDISLLMVRSNIDFKEIDIDQYKSKFKLVESYSIDLATAINNTRNLDPVYNEGYVLMDADFNRYKLKSPQFEVISELKINYDDTAERQQLIERDNFRKLCIIVKTNSHRTFLEHPKYASIIPQYERIYQKYTHVLQATKDFIDSIKHLSGKDLNDRLKNTDKYLNNLAYLTINGKYTKTIEDYFYDMNIKTFESLINTTKI